MSSIEYILPFYIDMVSIVLGLNFMRRYFASSQYLLELILGIVFVVVPICHILFCIIRHFWEDYKFKKDIEDFENKQK